MNRVIRVLVVDDSAFVRKVMKEILQRSPFIEVIETARDGKEALEKIESLNPDVVTLDLIMPEMDGIEFLEIQMKKKPIPIVVCSIASESGELALKALDLGAIDFVQKPTALATDRVYEMSEEIIEKVKAASLVPLSKIKRTTEELIVEPKIKPVISGKGLIDFIAIGISTGGPQALRLLISQIPENFPVPIAIVLHMPVGYTEAYAQKLNEISKINVFEAKEGDIVKPGISMIAPAGRHLTFIRKANDLIVAHLDTKPFDKPHRPSVDVLFRSAAETFGKRLLGIVMTGMGSDGLEGAAWIKSQGGIIFTEDEETCVVYGMPKVIVEAGLSDRKVPLNKMIEAIMEVI